MRFLRTKTDERSLWRGAFCVSLYANGSLGQWAPFAHSTPFSLSVFPFLCPFVCVLCVWKVLPIPTGTVAVRVTLCWGVFARGLACWPSHAQRFDGVRLILCWDTGDG
eukprot:Rmarinus@m.14971